MRVPPAIALLLLELPTSVCSREVYMAPGGSDATGDGTPLSPYLTVAACAAAAGSGGTCFAKGGRCKQRGGPEPSPIENCHMLV